MWIEIFKTGNHTDSSGQTEAYSEETLDKIVMMYNTKIAEDAANEAPVVKGHPKTDDPAFGWVERLARRGNKLMANLKDIAPEFAGEVRQGLYKKISIALYPDLMLRHIGFLGAVPPAVKGLNPVCFKEEIEFRNYDTDDMEIPENDDDDDDEKDKQMDELMDEVNNLQSYIDELNLTNLDLRAQIERTDKDIRDNEFREFANNLIQNPAGSIITPSHANDLINLLEIAHAADVQNRNSGKFSEGNSTVEKVKSFFSALIPTFNTKEFAVKSTAERNSANSGFSDKNVQADRMRLHERAKELQDDTPGLSYEEAIAVARREVI